MERRQASMNNRLQVLPKTVTEESPTTREPAVPLPRLRWVNMAFVRPTLIAAALLVFGVAPLWPTQYALTSDDKQVVSAWLAKHPGAVVLVNQATPRVERLYRRLGFTVAFLDGPRRISRNGDRSPAREIVATRNL